MKALFAKFTGSLLTRRGYVRFWTIAFGVPFALIMGLPYIHSDPVMTVVYVVLAPIGGYVGGAIMWKIYQNARAMEIKSQDRK